MRHSLTGAAATLALAGSAFATITPTKVYGDSYILKDGAGASAKFYSVLDVYIKGSNANDIISSTFGVSAWGSKYIQNQDKCFVHSNGYGTNDPWRPAAGQTAWDSFVTCGNRDQETAASSLQLQLDTNWGAGNGCKINNGAGWYPAVGANTSSNPYCRIGYYNGQTGPINTAKTDREIPGNGIVPGQRLDNHWMIGRFTIDVTQSDPSTPVADPLTMSLKFAVAGKNNGTVTFTGATSTAGRFNYTLNFAVPAPGAAALIGLAGMMTRRRARA